MASMDVIDGWKGIGFNELHVHNLTIALEGNALDLAMHHVQNDICNDHETKFWDLLKLLMCTYIKKSTVVTSTKAFKTLSYDSAKGVKHFYTQLIIACHQGHDYCSQPSIIQ